ncbi:MAG: ATP-binding protein [Caldisericaceae bacterium]|nr:ATP-binding protein [Caldisericaceae bacterium]
MVIRPFWIRRVQQAWQRKSLIWLSGVRRVGKTTLCKMLPDTVYLNCDLPSVQRQLEDPELFYNGLSEQATVIFDEVHRLLDPSLILKIGTDAYPHIKILATGSSTLAASKKFRDSLTGRKIQIHLPPIIWPECTDTFQINQLEKRLVFGGLPEMLLADENDPTFYSEWIDSFYARDIQELFGIRNREGFLKLFRLVIRQSGSLLEVTHLSKLSGLSRPTVLAHLEAMEISHVLFCLPPFHGGGRREITRRPKCYAFDTGFVAFVNGWDTLREHERGILWEHLVLDVLRIHHPKERIFYWRDKSQREIDFVLRRGADTVDAIEVKINPDAVNLNHFQAFRALYPQGSNYVISPSIKQGYRRQFGELLIHFTSLHEWHQQNTNLQ